MSSRFQRTFNPSRWRATGYAVMLFTIATAFLKFFALNQASQRAIQQYQQPSSQPQQLEQPMTSPGSSRLFVPPSLDN